MLGHCHVVVIVYRSLSNFGWLCAVFSVFFGLVAAAVVTGNLSVSPALMTLVPPYLSFSDSKLRVVYFLDTPGNS